MHNALEMMHGCDTRIRGGWGINSARIRRNDGSTISCHTPPRLNITGDGDVERRGGSVLKLRMVLEVEFVI
jgi:hypothetical protein